MGLSKVDFLQKWNLPCNRITKMKLKWKIIKNLNSEKQNDNK